MLIGSATAGDYAGGSIPGTVRLLVACLFLLLIGSLLYGCSAPVRAPVVSREHVPTQTRAVRPASYRVRSGDTLYAIAWRYGINYASIARWNGIRYPYTIYPGQKLRLTPGGSRSGERRKAIKTSQTKDDPSPKKTVVSRKAVTRTPARVAKPPLSTSRSSERLKLQWDWPTKGSVVERFVRGDPARKGVKIQGYYGATVKAAESGKVVYAGSGLIGYGRLVIIKHNKNYLSAYGHNRKIHVKEGDTVNRGRRIAEMGSDGEGKPMLHFEIRRNGAPVDPIRLLPRHP